MLSSHKSYRSVYWGIITDLPTKHIFYQPFGSWQLNISNLERDDCGREQCCWNSGWAGVLLLLSFLYRTWQYDNILSTILSDTRLWSSPIINPGWAPAQVVQERRPTDCQHVWQTPSIPPNLEMILHRRHFDTLYRIHSGLSRASANKPICGTHY